MQKKNKHRAFTLVEVLAALVIISFGMLAVIQAVGQAASNGAYLRDKSIAQWVALNQLTLMRVGQTPPAKGTSSGESEMAGQKWRWTAEVIDTPVTSMKRIDIAVRPSDGDENSQLAIVTGFYGERAGKPGTIIAQYTPSISPAGDSTTTTPQTPTPTPPKPPAAPTPTPDPATQPIVPGVPSPPQPQQPLIQ